MISWTNFCYHSTEQQQRKVKGREMGTSTTEHTVLQVLPPEDNAFRPTAQRR